MGITVTQNINASRQQVWNIVTGIDSWQDTISAITEVNVLERPSDGLVGLKWEETRTMFGKEAKETMWISAVEPTQWYETTANSHGMIYTSKIALDGDDNQTNLSMSFDCVPQTMGARIMSLFSFMFNGAVKKAFLADLQDIKAVAEKNS